MAADELMEHYDSVRTRVSELVASAPERLGASVPSCPQWTADDVVRHLAGIALDWAEGRLEDYGSNEWTRLQIARFDGESTGKALDQWGEAMTPLASMGEVEGMGQPSTWLFGDAIVHEADLRPVLAPGSRPPQDAVAIATKAGIARWRHHLAAVDLSLTIDAIGDRSWQLGDASASTPRVEVDPYELFRALYGRRAETQVRSWQWHGDPSPFLDAGLPYPFTWAAGSLND